MESARQDLILMVRLQRIYDKVRAALEERNTPPLEVRQLQEQNSTRREELEELEHQVEELEGELAEVRKKEREFEVELEHFQRQKGMVTNEREFTAVISEIDFATKGRDESAARRKELEENITGIKDDIETRRQARPEEEAAHSEVVASWEQRKGEIKQLVHDLAEQAQEIETRLQPNHRARFLRLLESKRGTATAEVVDGSCSLCHFALRPHLQQRVRRAEEIIACETCHRILYFTDIEAEPEAGTGS